MGRAWMWKLCRLQDWREASRGRSPPAVLYIFASVRSFHEKTILKIEQTCKLKDTNDSAMCFYKSFKICK